MMKRRQTLAAAAVVVAFPTAFAFQQGASRWIRGGSGRSTAAGAPSPSACAALPFLGDESHPDNVLPANPKGVIFDMDGTLIQHAIDFAEMRRRIYEVAEACPIGRELERECVLSLAPKLSPESQEECYRIFDDIERRAIEDMKIMPGGAELMHFLADSGLKRAVLTRNLEKNVPFMEDLYFEEVDAIGELQFATDGKIFHPIVARDTRSHPDEEEPLKAKPNPDGILHICNVWGCDPSEVIMVGDSANDDMTAANRAGCGGAVLLTQSGGESLDTDSGYSVGESEEEIWERTPSLRIESLLELKVCLEAVLSERDASGNDCEASSESMVYTSESGYSVVIPSIGVKRV